MSKTKTWERLCELGVVEGNPPKGRFNLQVADLSHADLSHANLSGAELAYANLIDAILICADLTDAVLYKAQLDYCNLTKANLTNATLVLTSFFAADLSQAILSGATVCGITYSSSIIKDVVCTHINEISWHSGFEKRTTWLSPSEFENRYTYLDRGIELLLDAPLDSLVNLIAHAFAHSINKFRGTDVIKVKGLEAISDTDTKMSFIVADVDFWEHHRKLLGTKLPGTLNKYLKEALSNRAKKNCLNPIARPTSKECRFSPAVMEGKALDYLTTYQEASERVYEMVSACPSNTHEASWCTPRTQMKRIL